MIPFDHQRPFEAFECSVRFCMFCVVLHHQEAATRFRGSATTVPAYAGSVRETGECGIPRRSPRAADGLRRASRCATQRGGRHGSWSASPTGHGVDVDVPEQDTEGLMVFLCFIHFSNRRDEMRDLSTL